jgi:glycerol kinase
MQRDSGVALRHLRVDGGASGNDLLMQIQADVLGLVVERPAVVETTALGAALLAGLAAGFFADATAVADARRVERRFEPRITAEERRRMLATWRDAVERSKGWARAR